MAKKLVSNSELTRIFWQKMLTYPECSHGFPVAIVPDDRRDWKALTAPMSSNGFHGAPSGSSRRKTNFARFTA